MRTCIGCHRKAPVDELVRVARLPDGALSIGRTLHGRGAWLCASSPRCVEWAERRRAFDRALRFPVSPAALAALRGELGRQAGLSVREGVTGESVGKGSGSDRALDVRG